MNTYQGTVCVELRASRLVRRVGMALHLVGALLVASAWPMTTASCALVAALAAHGAWLWRRLGAQDRARIRHLEIDGRGRWRLVRIDGAVFEARLAAAPLLLAWLVSLELRLADGRRHALLLVPDMLDSDAFRRLRVRVARLREE